MKPRKELYKRVLSKECYVKRINKIFEVLIISSNIILFIVLRFFCNMDDILNTTKFYIVKLSVSINTLVLGVIYVLVRIIGVCIIKSRKND